MFLCLTVSNSAGRRSSCPHSCLPVVILEALVPQQQVSEAKAGGQRRHLLALLLLHLQRGDVQDEPAGVDVGLGGCWGGAGGGRGEKKGSRSKMNRRGGKGAKPEGGGRRRHAEGQDARKGDSGLKSADGGLMQKCRKVCSENDFTLCIVSLSLLIRNSSCSNRILKP